MNNECYKHTRLTIFSVLKCEVSYQEFLIERTYTHLSLAKGCLIFVAIISNKKTSISKQKQFFFTMNLCSPVRQSFREIMKRGND